MAEEKLALYVDTRFASPYAMTVFVALTEKGIPFEIRKVDLEAKEHYQPSYASLSLTCRVPTLVHGDFRLSESSAISEYLDEVFSAPKYAAVYPGDVHCRARARQIQAWLRSDFMPIREERSTEVVFFKPTDKPLSESARISAARLFSAADSLLEENATKNDGAHLTADYDSH